MSDIESMPTPPTRKPDPRTEQLRELVATLTLELALFGGEATAKELSLRVAKQTGLSTLEMPYIINSAQADGLLTHSLRTDLVTLTRRH